MRTYINDPLVVTKGSFDDHLSKLRNVLAKLQRAGLKVNIEKSFFCRDEVEYLGFIINRQGISPIPKKVEAMLKITAPKTRKQLRQFIGMVNYYREMWHHRSDIMAPLTDLTSNNLKFKWTEAHQISFDKIKRAISKTVLLSFPNYSKKFTVYTDASKTQLGGVILQDNRPLAFYSRKLTSTQRRYTNSERELLSIVETLKEYKYMLLGQEIELFTDHKNLTYDTPTTDRVTRWRLLIEEYAPDIKYIKGCNNIVADALSRLEYEDNSEAPEEANFLQEAFVGEPNTSANGFPMDVRNIATIQLTDPELEHLRSTRNADHFDTINLEETDLVTYKNKIYVPNTLRRNMIEWYHNYLCHPGISRLTETLRRLFYWPGLDKDVKQHVKGCAICRYTKRRSRKYGKLPYKNSQTLTPWSTVCVDLIGPYTVDAPNGTFTLHALTILDPITRWIEIVEIPKRDSETVALAFDRAWLSRYPRPRRCLHDKGPEFTGTEFEELISTYNIKCKQISTKIPQANGILEIAHDTLKECLKTFQLQNHEFDLLDPWSGLLANVAYAIRSMYHTSLDATPSELVFGRDMILPVAYIANWEQIRNKNQLQIDRRTDKSNIRRVDYDYNIGDAVYIEYDELMRKLNNPRSGPYAITRVHVNGTVTLQKNSNKTDRINIRRISPALNPNT